MEFFDIDFIFKAAIHPCYRDFTFNPGNVDLGLVEFVFDPHFVELNFGFRKMETSLADDAYKATITGSLYLFTVSEYDLHCHYIPVLFGKGLFRIFLTSIRKAPG